MVAWQAQASKEPRDEHRTIHLHPSQTWGKIVLSPSQTWGQDHLDQMLFNIKQTFLTFCPTKYFLFIMAKFPDNWKVQSVLLFECYHFKLNVLPLGRTVSHCSLQNFNLQIEWLALLWITTRHDIGRTCFTEDPVEDVESLRMSSRNWKDSLSKGCQ